ncbi:MAG: hypothetical protein FWD22_00150 [Treponema sp.]|nr:hypothetical protein [Treponema sp.]
MNKGRYLIFFLLFSFFTTFVYSAPTWYEGIFLEGSAHNYFVPDVLKELAETKVGFRGALGYEYNNFRFALESGFSRITGTNPLVLQIDLIPLTFKFGYAYHIRYGLGLQADLGLGAAFSKTQHYKSVLAIVLDDLQESQEKSPFSTVRFYAIYSPSDIIKFYLGGGADLIFEEDGLIPLPLLEAGISFKFGKLIKRSDNNEQHFILNR